MSTVGRIKSPFTVVSLQLSVGTGSASPMRDQIVLQGVNVKSDNNNLGDVYVGAPGVTALTGYRLIAGESVYVACSNTKEIAVIGSVGTQIVYALGS